MAVRILLDDGTDGSVLVRRVQTEKSTSFGVRSPRPYEVVIVNTVDTETATAYPLLEG